MRLGLTNFDYITVEEATLRTSPPATPCSDPAATAQADSLMQYLSSVYGKHIISGQQEIYKYGPHDFEYEFNYIHDTTGKYPAIRG
ncbi:MAG: glycosyl hydrolase [Ruminococcus callidus]